MEENNFLVNDLDKFSGGMYIVVITTGTEKIMEKFFILNSYFFEPFLLYHE